MSNILKKIFIVIIIIIFLVAFSASYTSSNIGNLAVVVAIGLDVSDTNKIKVTFQFTNSSSVSDTGSSKPVEPTLFSIDSSSISNAINLMNTNIGKDVNLSHCKLIVFCEELASEGIAEEIYTLSNNTEVRPSANIVISKCEATTYLKNSKPTLESLITQYYEVFVNSSQFTGFNSNATIGDFLYAMTCDACDPYAMLGGISTQDSNSLANASDSEDTNLHSNFSPASGQYISENTGLAVFKEDKLVGELNAIENLCFMIIDNKVDGFLISVPNPKDSNSFVDVYFTPIANTSIDAKIVNNSPYIKINCRISGRVYSLNENANYSDPQTLEELSNSCSNYLESIISDYLYKTSKVFNSDITKLGKYIRKNFLTESEYKDYNWSDRYQDSVFEIKVNASIKSSFLLTET